MQTKKLDGRLFTRMVEGGAARLFGSRKVVNDLNVFPIPDGDTGDNMYMTIDSGVSAAEGGEEGSIGGASGRIAEGMLLGARGNSGVILSRIFAGISQGLKGLSAADTRDFAAAMENGVQEAYRAVSRPVEGTILTVIADGVRYANSRLGAESDLESYFDDLGREMRASLDRTPELLPVLKEAGVVDSGGAGLVYIAEGMQDALLGRELPERGETASSSKVQKVDIASFTEDTELEFGYYTEFLLRLQTKKVGPVDKFDETPLKQWLSENGESLVFFRDGSLIRVHVHSMEPERILEHCHAFGEFLTMKMENMLLQHNESEVRNGYTPPKARKKFGIVAVAAGEGIKKTFKELGADAVVDGGQSMNPSAESFINAFSEVNAEHILVYPNNSNIILTAKQAASLYKGAEVRVLPSKSVGECYAALSLLDTSSGDIDEIERGSEQIMASIMTGTVSRASRNTVRDGLAVREGEFIGFSDGRIYSASPDISDAAAGLMASLHAEDYGILMLVCGCDTEAQTSMKLKERLEKLFPMTEVILLDGGQPVYDYIMILE